ETCLSYKLHPLDLSPNYSYYTKKQGMEAVTSASHELHPSELSSGNMHNSDHQRMDIPEKNDPWSPAHTDSPISPNNRSETSNLPRGSMFSSMHYSAPSHLNIKTEDTVDSRADDDFLGCKNENRQVVKDLEEYVIERQESSSSYIDYCNLHEGIKDESKVSANQIKQEKLDNYAGVEETLECNKITYFSEIKGEKQIKQEMLNQDKETEEKCSYRTIEKEEERRRIQSVCLKLQKYSKDLGIYGPSLEHVVSQILAYGINMCDVIQMADFHPLMELLVINFKQLIENSVDYKKKEKYREGLSEIYLLIEVSKQFNNK
ncbi:unnamed protein product, partial [Meganyctiphanes norvegica]